MSSIDVFPLCLPLLSPVFAFFSVTPSCVSADLAVVPVSVSPPPPPSSLSLLLIPSWWLCPLSLPHHLSQLCLLPASLQFPHSSSFYSCSLSNPPLPHVSFPLHSLNLTWPACLYFDCPTLISSALPPAPPPSLLFIYIDGGTAVRMDWWMTRGHGWEDPLGLMDALVTQDNTYRIGWFVIVKVLPWKTWHLY